MKMPRNRYILLIIAAIINFPSGSAAIWSVFQPYAMEYFGVEMGIANMPFSVYMAMFVIGNIVGGYLQSKLKPKVVVYICSGVMCLGFLLTGVVPSQWFWGVSVTYGILGGMGSGAVYNVILATISKWFLERKGFASGIVVCVVGANGFIMSPVCNKLLNDFGFSKAMLIVGVIYFIIINLGVWTIHEPDAVAIQKIKSVNVFGVEEKNYTAKQMVKQKKFYMISGAMAFCMVPYFMISPMLKTLGMQRGLSETLAVTTVMTLAVMNCAGRLIATSLSDKFGRKSILSLLLLISMVSVLGLTRVEHIGYIICTGLVALCYGGFFGIFPVVSLEQFGSKNAGLNYGIIMIGYGVVSLICPFLVNIGIKVALMLAAISCVLGMALISFALKNDKN